jgi:ubiquinone/menaquinone biosynthesis C-methylase UbiE/DNA-binding transcriptional ArsR family regulator
MNGSLPASTSPAGSRQHGGPGGTAGQDAPHLIELLRTLADPIRLRMVRLLESTPQPHGAGSSAIGSGGMEGGSLSVGEFAEILKLPQSTVSRHLKILTDAGLADSRRDGTSAYYRLSDAAGRDAARQLRQLARPHLDHDPQARNDAHRLAAIRRRRDSVKSGADSFFGKHAPQWDQLRTRWFGDTFHLEGLLALMSPAWTVADVGAGTGAMLPLLAPHVRQVIAVDPSAAMLKGARARIKNLGLNNVDVRQGSAEHLPVDNACVDVALLALVLAYTADPYVALREIHRVLKPGGVLLIIDLQPHDVELFREKLNHRHMGFSREQLADWLAAAGFTIAGWHPLSPPKGRSKESATPIPDLFVIRAEAA